MPFLALCDINKPNKTSRDVLYIFQISEFLRCLAGTFQGAMGIAGTKSTFGGLRVMTPDEHKTRIKYK